MRLPVTKERSMRRSLATGSMVALLAALLLVLWGIQLVFLYRNGGVVNIRLATAMLISGVVGGSFLAAQPIYITVIEFHALTIYSCLGLVRAQYDLPGDVVSAQWVTRSNALVLHFTNGKKYRLPRGDFLRLSKVFEGVPLPGLVPPEH